MNIFEVQQQSAKTFSKLELTDECSVFVCSKKGKCCKKYKKKGKACRNCPKSR